MDKKKLLDLPFNKDILMLCMGNKNIQEIADAIGLTYKTTFNRIKDLEKADILLLQKDGVQTKITIKDKDVSMKLLKYSDDEKTFQKDLKDETDLINKILSFYKNNRFGSDSELYDYLKENKITFMNNNKIIPVLQSLENLDYIKRRLEITKKGLKFLKDNKTK